MNDHNSLLLWVLCCSSSDKVSLPDCWVVGYVKTSHICNNGKYEVGVISSSIALSWRIDAEHQKLKITAVWSFKTGWSFFSSVKTYNRLRRDIWRIRVNEHFWNVILFNLNLAIAFLGLLWNLETYIRKYLRKGIFYHEQLIHKRFLLEVAYNRKEKFPKC